MVKLFLSITMAFFVLFCITSCEENVATPKPRAYPRVVYPSKAYQAFDANYCNFTFDQPQYASVVQDTTYFEEKAKNPCWFNLEVPSLNAKIYFSYNPLRNRADLEEAIKDAYDMTNRHNAKASYIDEKTIHRTADKVYGVLFEVEGPVASTYQFYVTDSLHHFLRGALYFETKTRPDSIAPVAAFMKKDIDRMIGTLKWK
jgi:gliding motility-associated lipoprotein GldD